MRRRSNRQTWAEDGDRRARVLLECEPAASPSIIATVIERSGYEVLVCEGPSSTRCPLLHDRSCSLVAGADVVVNMLGTSPRELAVLDAMADMADPTAVVYELRRGAGSPLAHPTPAGVTALRFPMTKTKLLAAIEQVLEDRPGSRAD